MDAITYSEAIGAFVRGYRQSHAITLDSLAQAGREFGATWSVSSVQAIEGGKAAPTLPTLLTLALALGHLSGQPVRLVDLLGSAEAFDRPYVNRSEGLAARKWVDRALLGEPVVADGSEHDEAMGADGEWDEEVELAALAHRGREIQSRQFDMVDAQWAAMNEPPEPGRDRKRRSGASLAESRAAKKLGVPALELQRRALQLWGRSLEAEVIARADVDSTPQARGRVTRVLVNEIRECLGKER